MSIEWDGKGFPPVGFVGIADFDKSIGTTSDIDRFIGEAVTVVGNFEVKNGDTGIVVSHKTKGVGAIMYYKDGIIKPIKSERDKAIEEMQSYMEKIGYLLSKHCYADLYDAGYRKIKE